MKEQFYNYGQSLGVSINDLQRLMSLAKDVIKSEQEPVPIDWKKLREKYFAECIITVENRHPADIDIVISKYPTVCMAPHDLFEWFKKNITR